MGNYESVKIGASIEVSPSDIPGLTKDPTTMTDEELVRGEVIDFYKVSEYADKLLEEAIAKDIKEAGELTNTRDSFILSWGKK